MGLPLTLFVSIKSGDITGEHRIGIRLREPDGTQKPKHDWPIVLKGGQDGANLKIEFTIATPKDGLYWFDVLWEEEEILLTSIPVSIKVVTQTQSGPPQAESVPNKPPA